MGGQDKPQAVERAARLLGRDRPTQRALAFGAVGDVALLGGSDAAFSAGLASFLAGHVAWIIALRQRPGGGRLRARPALAVPYLGAFGHALIMSDDMRDAVHSHPSPGPESDISRGFGGPDVTFEGYMPRPGLYRAWSQFLRGGTLTTFSFTFSVHSLEEAVKLQGLR